MSTLSVLAKFLNNHLSQAVGIDFFTIPSATFRVFYGFVVLDHRRRRIRHMNVTEHPTAAWIRQQLLEAFPFDAPTRFLHRDRDTSRSFQLPDVDSNHGHGD